MEDGKSLTQIGGNAVKNIVYDRVVDKVTSKVPTPGGNPMDKVGFAKKTQNATERATRHTRAPLTRAEAKKIAQENGWRKMNERVGKHGAEIYDRGTGHNPRYVSPDIDNHSGGTWKGANDVRQFNPNGRTGTYDKDMNRIGD